MNDFYIYLSVEPYLKAYLEHHFGNPVRLPERSPEHDLIFRLLQPGSKAPAPDTGEGSNLMIRIPSYRKKNPAVYNYFPNKAKRALVGSLDGLFRLNLWKEMNKLSTSNSSLTDLIYAWMELHGIPEEHWETIRQKYYRMRDRYDKKGIAI